MRIVGVIPARMASSRMPGKPLAPILGMPMIGHVYLRSKLSKSLDEVYVATCDEEIRAYVASIGGRTIMTAATHERASDRTAEALETVERETGRRVDIVVMIQGDEPMVTPEMIDSAIAAMLTDDVPPVVNLMAPLKSREEHDDPNEIKVVVDRQNSALYFSREPIPSRKKGATEIVMLKQVCIIPFRTDFLLEFNRLPPTPLEIIESIDMLRILEHGYRVKMVPSLAETYSVDTLDDLHRVERLMREDRLVEKYGPAPR